MAGRVAASMPSMMLLDTVQAPDGEYTGESWTGARPAASAFRGIRYAKATRFMAPAGLTNASQQQGNQGYLGSNGSGVFGPVSPQQPAGQPAPDETEEKPLAEKGSFWAAEYLLGGTTHL